MSVKKEKKKEKKGRIIILDESNYSVNCVILISLCGYYCVHFFQHKKRTRTKVQKQFISVCVFLQSVAGFKQINQSCFIRG